MTRQELRQLDRCGDESGRQTELAVSVKKNAFEFTVYPFKSTEYRNFLTKAFFHYIMPTVGGDQTDDLQAAAGSES